ncbi:serine hydrolase domain-containing protein [Yoonia sp. SS1-5]|uniref:Serine hydrolase domain-containing protein n=1 Tax=Yoonia rhodophyticola TaxID=3137370 RepID=A0AAN0MA37_9RHOB
MRLISCLAMILALMLCGPLAAQTGSAQGQDQSAVDPRFGPTDIDAWLDGFVPLAITQANIAGAVIVVVDRGGIVFQQGYGLSDIAAAKPVSATDTLFRPGSISKLFTWTAVMQQVERGHLDLDADINTYLDFEIPPYQDQPITLRQIMTHTPGFEEALRYLFTADLMPLETYIKQSLPARVFAPGSTPAYSNYGSALAGYIVERVSSMPFNDYVDANILGPLDMTNATFAQPLPAALADQMARGYQDARSPPRDFEIISAAPAGALSASGQDMGKFMIAHLNAGRGLLRPATARMMHDYRAPGIDGLNRMALGFVEKWVNGHRGIGHGGDTQGFHSDLTLFPDAGIGLYISLNSGGTAGESFAIRQLLLEGFADRYLPEVAPIDLVPGVDAETARAHLDLVAGSYVSSRGSFTNFLSLAGFLGQTPVGKTADGKLSFPMLDSIGIGPFDWVEVEPFIWQDRYSSQTIAAEVIDGQVVRLSTDIFSPVTVLTPAPASQNAATLLPLLVVALLTILLQAVLWPTRLLVRRKFGAALALDGGHLAAYRLTGLFSWVVLIAIIGWVVFAIAVSADVTLLGGGLDWLINALRIVLPLAAIGLVLASAAHLILSFNKGRAWLSHLGRILLLLSALLILWIVFSFNLYGLGLQF